MDGRVGFRGFDLKCESAADALVSTGLAAKGYNYVNIGMILSLSAACNMLCFIVGEEC